jgi:uncharacterized Fe-S cluster-containing protein
MKIEILKQIKITAKEGRKPFLKGDETEVEDNIGEILIRKGFAKEIKEDSVFNVKDTVELIEGVIDLEGLKEFESDERKGVINAVEAKKAELKKED